MARTALFVSTAFAVLVKSPPSLGDYLTRREPDLSITAETIRCRWLGETMDLSQAIEAMQLLESKAVGADCR